MLIQSARYVPLGLPPAALIERNCIKCEAPFTTRCPTKIRCDACQVIRTAETQAKGAAKLKAKRKAARDASLSARTNTALTPPGNSRALQRQ
jgi:hypothetical protein